MLRMIQEEEGEAAPAVNFSAPSSSSSLGGGGLGEYLSFALACATGYEEPPPPQPRDFSSSGIRWNPTGPPASSSPAKPAREVS